LHKPENLSPRVQRKRDAKTQSILAAAEKIVVAEGLDALTIHRLARDLDYAPGALYRYFSSKEALIAELSCRAVQRIHEQLKSAEHETPASIKDPQQISLGRLLKAAALYVRLSQSDPAAYRLVSSLLGDPEHLLEEEEATRVHNEALPVLLGFADLIRAAEETKALSSGPSVQRAVAFWAGLQGIVQLRKLVRRSTKLQPMVDPELIAHRFVQDLLRGWGASEDKLAAAYYAYIKKEA